MKAKAQERKRVQIEITRIERARKTFVAQVKKEKSEAQASTLDQVVKQALRKQAEAKQFSFDQP